MAASKLLAAVLPGQTITLTADQGVQNFMNQHFDPPIVVDAGGFTLAGWTFQNCSGITLKNATLKPAKPGGRAIMASGMDRFAVTASRFVGSNSATDYGFTAGDSTNASVTGCVFTNLLKGLGFGAVTGGVIQGNAFEGMNSDAIDVAESCDITIAANVVHGTLSTTGEHPDGIQMWSRATSPPCTNITIEDNLLVGTMQGIFLGDRPAPYADGGYGSVIIRRNRVCTAFPNGIGVYNCRDLILEDNAVSTYPGSRFWTKINLPGTTVTSRKGNTVGPGGGKPAVNDPAA